MSEVNGFQGGAISAGGVEMTVAVCTGLNIDVAVCIGQKVSALWLDRIRLDWAR